MPSAGDAKRGSNTWGPPGGVAGTCLTCGNPARSSRAFYCEEHKPVKGESPVRSPSVEDSVGVASAEEPDGVVIVETRPTPPESNGKAKAKGLLGSFWQGKEKPKPGPAAPTTSEKKPETPKRRVSTAEFWGDAISPVSAFIGKNGYVPMARAMQWSSPVAGEIIEDATKGTLVDKAVQPLCRNAAKWQDLFDLLGFWAAIGAAQKDPAHSAAALGFARKRLLNLLPRIASNIKKEREKERKAVEALTELMPEIKELFPNMGPNDDPVAVLIASLFAFEGEPSEEGEFAGVA